MSNLVEEVLKENVRARSNDRLLIIAVWEKQLGLALHPKLARFLMYKAIMPETITRTRRKLQEDGKYLATKEVEEQRYQKFVDAKHTGGQSVLF